MSYDSDTPIPKWLIKGKKLEFPNKTLVTFAGQKDHLIIITEKGSNLHATFVIKPSGYQFHSTEIINDQKKREDFFDINKDVIIDLVKHWMATNSHLIKMMDTKMWIKTNENVLDMNSMDFINVKRRAGFFDIEPESVKTYRLSKDHIVSKLFMGFTYDDLGYCKGMIIPYRKTKKMIIVERKFMDLIMDTAIGIDYFMKSFGEKFNTSK